MSALNLTGRGRLSAMFASFGAALALLLLGASSALADTNCGPPNSLGGSCFAAGDGNQADGPGDLIDWQSYVPLAALADGPKGNDSKYKGGSKELAPGGWEFITGNNTPKTDLLNGWGRLDAGYLNVAFTRVKQNGNTYLGFELNQLGAGPRTSGGIPVPHRSTGDVLVTYDISTTNKVSVGMCIWSGNENAGNWLRLDGTVVTASLKTCTHLDPTTIPSAMGAVNFGQALSAAQNWLEDHDSGIGAGQFGEASVNLNALPEGAGKFLTDPCGPNGWFWMHSRASDTVTSQPKDILPGKPIADPTCGLEIDKKVSLSGADGTFTDADAANPLAAEAGDTVTYSMTLKNTGTADLTVDLNDPLCDSGSISGPDGRDGSGDPLAAGESVTYKCTHLLAADPDPLTNTACTTGTATLGSASKTLGLDPTICDSATVDVFQPGELSKATGSKFQDTNGNGSHDGDEGPLAGFVFYVDYNGNGALDPGEPAAVSGDGGQWQISGIKPGDWPVREVADANFTCTMPADGCSRTVTFTAGQTSDGGEFGNKPNQIAAPEEKPGQIVLGERLTGGRARLLGPSGCRARAFHARVAGTKIAKVVFILDGKKIKTLRKVNFHKTFAVRIDPRHLRIGVHRLIARVTFQRGSGTKAKQFRLSFQRCPRALRAPRFTG